MVVFRRRFSGVPLEKLVFSAAGLSAVCVLILYLLWRTEITEEGNDLHLRIVLDDGGARRIVSQQHMRWTNKSREKALAYYGSKVNLPARHSTSDNLVELESKERQNSRTRGFLLAANYDQQLQAALHAYTQLAAITHLLNLSSVEPFVMNTNLAGVSNTDPREIKLGDLYEMTEFKSKLRSSRILSDLVSPKVFLEKASRQIVLVVFLTDLRQSEIIFHNGGAHFMELNMTRRDDTYHSVLRLISSDIKKMNQWAFSTHSPPFRLSNVLLFNAQPYHSLPLSDIINNLNGIITKLVAKFGSATVLVERWRGIHNVSNSKFFYYVPGFMANLSRLYHTLPFSDKVLTAAAKFSKSLQSSRLVIGVHIRGERLLLDSKGNTSTYLLCLKELKDFLSRKVTDEQEVYVFHDLGFYGTKSCSLDNCVNGRQKFLNQVEHLGFSTVSFDPEKFDLVPKGPAFVSLVEMEYLSHVDELVTVGRGGFQQAVVERFLQSSNGKTDRLHRICNTRPERPWKPPQ